jgi:hypothetical protein
MSAEYREGPEAKERFETAMKSLFQAPKAQNPKKRKLKTATTRKSKRSDKD